MQEKILPSIVIGCFVIILILVPLALVFAQGGGPTETGGGGPSETGGGGPTETGGGGPTGVQSLNLDDIDPLKGATIKSLLHKIVTWLRNIAAPIAAGMIIYGAYQMLFAAGDPEKFKVGRQTILYTVIGYAIIWIGWGITSIIKEFLSTP